MTVEEAREVLREALKYVDFVNLGRVLSALGEYDYTWAKFDNSKWRPDKHLALKESVWLATHAKDIQQALVTLSNARG